MRQSKCTPQKKLFGRLFVVNLVDFEKCKILCHTNSYRMTNCLWTTDTNCLLFVSFLPFQQKSHSRWHNYDKSWLFAGQKQIELLVRVDSESVIIIIHHIQHHHHHQPPSSTSKIIMSTSSASKTLFILWFKRKKRSSGEKHTN